jgi:hypothetical protein
MKIILQGLFIFSFSFFRSQEKLQVLRGRILDGETQIPVRGATVVVSASIKTVSDSLGNYSFQLPPGKYSLRVLHEKFKAQRRDNIVLLSARQQVQDFELESFSVSLDTVAVSSGNELQKVEVDGWGTQRYAGTFYDPARVASTNAGVVNADDQANTVSVRGTSPVYVQWKLEGVEIVNPNHLENAGTSNDRLSFNGGGVSILSAQLLQNSSFRFAPFDAMSGNALSGFFDVRFRRGNEEKTERTIQASLLGTDVCVEGPFSKNKKASYLVNFRYSTVGLLSQLGVNFGNEKINYADLSFLFSFHTKLGQLKIFSIAGMSENKFKGQTDTALAETQKDLQDINYKSLTVLGGASLITSISNTSYFKSVLVYSGKNISRDAVPLNRSMNFVNEEREAFNQQKITWLGFYSKKLGNDLRLKSGTHVNYFTTLVSSSVQGIQPIERRVEDPLLQPFISAEGTWLKKMQWQLGLHGFYQVRINYFSLQPRAQLKFNPNENHSFSFNYGIATQLQAPYFYVAEKDLIPTQSNSYSLNHFFRRRSLTFKTELFYQLFKNVPVSANGFSGFNYLNGDISFPLQQNGTAETYGLDLTLEKKRREFYLIFSSCIYDSRYSTGTFSQSAKFNTNYNFVLSMGNEFKLKNEKKFIDVNLRSFFRNGFREAVAPNEFFYPAQLPAYFRLDLRISYRKNGTGSSWVWALDIQNVSNRKNIAYHYFDTFTQRTETRYQLGLIPVLSYKVFF